MMINSWKEILTGIQTKHIIQAVIIGALIGMAISVPFLHYKYKKLDDWKPYSDNLKLYDKIIDETNFNRELLIDELEKGELSNTEFVEGIRALELKKQTDLAVFYEQRNVLRNEYSYIGYSSYRYFLYAIGLPIFALFVSVLLLVFIFNPAHVKSLKYFYLIAAFACIYVACFWVSHSFLTETDFPKWTYSGPINLIALVSALALFFLIRFFSNRHKKIEILVNWILEIRNNYFQKVALRAMETNEAETIDDIIDFETRTKEELSKIVE